MKPGHLVWLFLVRPARAHWRCYDKLHLQINESKSAVASVFGRKFLGYALWAAGDGEVRRGVSQKALEVFKQRVRRLTRRNGGSSREEVSGRRGSSRLGGKGERGRAHV